MPASLHRFLACRSFLTGRRMYSPSAATRHSVIEYTVVGGSRKPSTPSRDAMNSLTSAIVFGEGPGPLGVSRRRRNLSNMPTSGSVVGLAAAHRRRACLLTPRCSEAGHAAGGAFDAAARRVLDQLHEHSHRAARVKERHRAAARSGSGMLVHEAHLQLLQARERRLHVGDAVADVVETGAVAC